jgi:hypothetical protein
LHWATRATTDTIRPSPSGQEEELARPRPESTEWLKTVARLVSELDELELPFTDYDRQRFGGPVSRDRYINEVRERFGLTASVER